MAVQGRGSWNCAIDSSNGVSKTVANRRTNAVPRAFGSGQPSRSRPPRQPKPVWARHCVVLGRTHLRTGAGVQLSILGLNLVYAALGVVLMYVSYRLIDRLTPEVDFPAELKRGNIAVAIFIAALVHLHRADRRARHRMKQRRWVVASSVSSRSASRRKSRARNAGTAVGADEGGPRARARRAGARSEEDQRAIRSDPSANTRNAISARRSTGATSRRRAFAESGLESERDELGRRARHHAAHAVHVSGDRVAAAGVRPDRSAGVEHRRRHHARPLSVEAVGEGHPGDDERYPLHVRELQRRRGTITRALAVAKNKGGSPEWTSVELIAPTVGRWRYTETLGYVRRIDSTYSSFSRLP